MPVKTTVSVLPPHNWFLFAGLSPDEAKRFAVVLPPPVSFEKGTRVTFPADGSRALGIVLGGTVCVWRSGSNGKEQNCNRLTVGEAFGAATLFADTAPVSGITAGKDCVVQFVPEADLQTLLRAEPRIAENLVRFLTDRIRFLNHSLNRLRGGSAAERLLPYLQSAANAHGVVTLPSLASVATALDMGRTSLYRAFDELEQAGLLTRCGKTVTLTDRAP